MALSDFIGFPIYRENLLTGPSHVSLAIPGLNSVISKSIGMTSSAMLLVPNIDFLLEFAKGNLGISDNLWKSVISANMNSPQSANNEGVFKSFAKANDLPLDDINKYKKSGKFKMPVSAVELSSAFDGSGLKAFEKTTILSIFESQKPYMEIARTVASLFVGIEDVVARIMPLVSLNPLTHKSEIPKMNGGGVLKNRNRPKAAGFKNGEEINEALKKLKSTSSKGGKMKVNKNGSVTKESTDTQSTDLGEFLDQNVSKLQSKYKIIKVQYSTGQFDPNEDYIYTFIDLPPDSAAEPDNSLPEDEDPYDKYKPEKIILGIYNSKGVPVNPNEFLKAIGYSGNQIIERETTYKRAEWITKSDKWKFRGGDFTWPTLGTPNYVFERGILTQVAKTAPDKYTLKKYKKDEKNILTNETAIEGDPVIDSFDSTDSDAYTKFFTEYTNINLNLAKDLEPDEREEARKEIISRINVPSHLENLSNYGQNKKTVYKALPDGQPAFPEVLKTIFKPYQIYSASASADPKLAGLNGLIWIDPEADYETKVIRVDPVFKIKTIGAKSESKLDTTIKSFVKNLYEIKNSDNSNFGIEVKRNNNVIETVEGTKVYNLDNWNYQNGDVVNTNTYTYKMWSIDPIYEYRNITSKTWNSVSTSNGVFNITIKKEGNDWKYVQNTTTTITGDRVLGDLQTYVYVENGIIKKWYYKYDQKLSSTQTINTFILPEIGIKKSVTLNVNDRTWTTSQTSIPLYSLKVTDLSNPGGTIIDPSKVDNSFLSGNELFSKGKYGVGDPDNPQEIDIIERYQITDLDTESYYIIEGVRADANKTSKPDEGEASGGGKKWYRLPQAIGAIMVFIKILIQIFTKLVPAITKLIKLLKNPIEFITDIISEKLGESFEWLSKDAFKAFTSLIEVVKKREEILKKGGSAYVDKVKQIVRNSPLKDYVFVNGFGKKISSLSAAINDITKSVTQNVTQVGNDITKNLGGAAANITTFGSGIASNLSNQTGNIANTLQSQVGGLLSNLQGQGQNLLNQGQGLVSNLQGQAGNIVGNLQGQAGNIVGNLQGQAGNIVGNLQGQGQNLLNQGQGLVSNLQGQAGNIVGNLQGQGQNLLNQGQGLVSNLQGQAGNIVGNLPGQANNLQGQAGNIINNVSTTGVSFFDSTTGQVSTIVGNFSQSVSNNLSGKTQEIASLVEKAGKDIKFSKGVLSIADRAMNNTSLLGNKSISPILKQTQGLGDFKFLLDGVGIIPFSIFNFNLGFGLELNFSNLINKKAPIKLLFDKSKRNNSEKKDPCADTKSDTNSVSNNTANNNNNSAPKNPENGYQIVSTWYSTGQFLEGVDYNYYYVTQENEELLNEVDSLENTGNPDDVFLAKEKLQEAIKKNPFDETLKEKLKDIKLKLLDTATATQPILKLVISLVSLPLKIIADIIQWILCFFKGLVNPLTLPAKLVEFFSFQWLLKFVTPLGILQTLGIKFNPQLLLGWVGKAFMSSQSIDQLNDKFSEVSNTLNDKTKKTADSKTGTGTGGSSTSSSTTSSSTTSSANSSANSSTNLANKSGKDSLIGSATEQVKKAKGYLYSDDYELANLSEFFSAPFLAPLPTFTAGNFRGLLKNISSKYISALLKTDSLEQINKNLNKLKSVVTENKNTLSTLVGKNSQITQNFNSQVLLSITQQVEAATGTFNTLAQRGSTLFAGSNIADNLSISNNLTSDVVNQITGNLQGQAGNIVGNLQGQASNIVGNLQGQAGNIVGNLQGQAGNIVGNLQGQAGNIVGNLQGQAGNLANQIASNLQGQTVNLTNNLNNIGPNIVNNLLNANSAILNNLTQRAAFVLEQVKKTASLLLKQVFKLPFFQLIFPSLCFIEKVVNGFINFIWSLLGIEVIIPPPQIKLCKTKNPLDLQKVLNGEIPSSSKKEDDTEVNSTIPYEEQKVSEDFIYEVKLSDGTVKTFLDREALDDFMSENSDVNFDLQF